MAKCETPDSLMEEQWTKAANQAYPELASKEWLDRCRFPLGMDDQGNFWPLEGEGAGGAGPKPPSPSSPASQQGPSPREIMGDRYRGCLLGGAVGDALGYPVEFLKEGTIWAQYGPHGIQTLEQAGSPARISDDTQMTLFAAAALEYGQEHSLEPREALWLAWREWLGTQGDTSRMEDPAHPRLWPYRVPQLHARRAPGNTCLSAIRTSPRGGTMQQPVNNSKGCGTVMRAAPFGLAMPAGRNGMETVYQMAAEDAALTHGHPLAWASSGVLAQLLHWIVWKYPVRDYRLEDVIPHLAATHPQIPAGEGKKLGTLLTQAVQLALDPSVSDLDGIHGLGKGWVAEEALAIAVFCAVRYQNDFAAGVRAAVNHEGDSDSTGAICGNILGAWLGKQAVEQAFHLDQLELRDVVEQAADRLFASVAGPETPAPSGPEGGKAPQPVPRPAAPKPAPSPSVSPMAPLRPVGLMYTTLTKKALAICWDAHRNQTDKGGLPYIIHPLHLAEQMETEEEVCAALLHDVPGKSPCTLENLRQAGMPPAVLEAVRLLNREPGIPYLEYVARLRRNPIARRVKLAELLHNSDPGRLEPKTETDQRRLLRYRMAQAILEDDDYDPFLEHFRKRIPLALGGVYYLSVFYDVHGQVEKYCWDVELAEDSHYEFAPQDGERLRKALNPKRTLPEALAERMPMFTWKFETILGNLGIPYQAFHFD